MSKRGFDIVIIGAGIVGAMVARFLSRYSVRILVLEKQADVCMGASGGNAATIHTGHSSYPGSLKALMNVRANPMWDSLSFELSIPYERRGDYVVAIGPEELSSVDRLLSRGKQNGVLGLEIISGEEMRKREPGINPLVSGALWSKNGGFCDPWMATIASMENARQNGTKILLGTTFEDFIVVDNQIVGVRTSRGDIRCRWVINAAGIYADEIMHKLGIRPDFKITPRSGEFCILKTSSMSANNLLAPIPNIITKGISVKPTFDGNLLVGANANDTTDKNFAEVTKDGIMEIWRGAKKMVPNLDKNQILATMIGLRASGNAKSPNPAIDYQGDFVIEVASEIKGLINLAGIESPGLAASPAIAIRTIELLKECGEKLVEKASWNPIRNTHDESNQAVLDRANRLKQLRYKGMPRPIANSLDI